GFDDIYSLQQTTDGGYILAGATDSYAGGWQDAWLVKVSNEITPVTLTVTASPSIITAGDPTSVTFSVTNILGMPQSGITVDLTGTATGTGTTDANGNVVINVNSPKAGATTATASKTGFISASTRISAIKSAGTLWITATQSAISAGTPTSVKFTVTNLAGVAQSGAKVELTGTATGSGTTDASGNVDITVNAANAGIITATASKFGFMSSNLIITVIKGTPTSTPTTAPTTTPTSVPTSTPTLLPTITSTATPPALVVTSNPATVRAGTPASVIFTLTSAGAIISGATITLEGAATGSGTTDGSGKATITVNAAKAGTITATAIKTGFTEGSITITATGGVTAPATEALSIPTAASPTIVTLQGKLTDNTGNPVQTGSMKVTIKDSSGAQVWQETFDDVIDNGVFNVPLGAIQELSLVSGSIYGMEVVIDADSRKLLIADVTFGDNSPAGDVIKFKA
ncbi:MAG: hypothetical protein OIN85_06860, partial [Candidatus Methanoperedens sp.]|nr:hypothetical protein [Candidatus Methanoperedens sp.]